MNSLSLRSDNASPSLATPAVVRSAILDNPQRRSFLADVVIEHGPRELLGRLLLRADTALREKGIFVSFTDCEEIVAINRNNRDSWGRVVPVFDPACSDLGPDNCVALVGRDANGKPVLAHASRLFALGSTTIKDEIESLRMFYRDPATMSRPNEAAICTSPKAAATSGNAVYGGALWLHPEARGKDVHSISGPLMRCLSYTMWEPVMVFSLMFPKLVQAGLAASWRLSAEFGVTLVNSLVMPDASPELAFVWIDRDEQLALFDTYAEAMSGRQAQVDGAILDRAPDQKFSG